MREFVLSFLERAFKALFQNKLFSKTNKITSSSCHNQCERR